MEWAMMDEGLKMQMRNAAMVVWPSLLNGERANVTLVTATLHDIHWYDQFAAFSIVTGWQSAGWVMFSPDQSEFRLTPKGVEQFARWKEEDRLWESGGDDDPKMPKRLKAGEPANNLRRIAAVIGNRTIACIHDPYTDIRSLENLLKVMGLGVRISQTLMILGSPKPNINLRTVGQFLRNDLNVQNKSQWEMRTYNEGGHRRFVVCADGSVVTFGLSLNHLNKDEVLESIPANDPHAVHDRNFFEEKWKSSDALPT